MSIVRPIVRPPAGPISSPLRGGSLPWEDGGGGAPAFNPLTDSELLALYRETTVDAGSGACSEWTELLAGTLDAVQGTSAARPTIAAADSDLNDQPALSFDGGDSLAVTAGAAADWTCLHDATDVTWWLAFYSASTGATQTLISTLSTVTAAATGITIRYDGTSENLDLVINNSSGTSVVNVSSAPASVAISTPHFLVFRKDADSWELWCDGALLLSGGYTGTPSTGAPAARLQIARLAGGTQLLTGKLAEVGVTQAYRDAALVSAYGVARY